MPKKKDNQASDFHEFLEQDLHPTNSYYIGSGRRKDTRDWQLMSFYEFAHKGRVPRSQRTPIPEGSKRDYRQTLYAPKRGTDTGNWASKMLGMPVKVINVSGEPPGSEERVDSPRGFWKGGAKKVGQTRGAPMSVKQLKKLTRDPHGPMAGRHTEGARRRIGQKLISEDADEWKGERDPISHAVKAGKHALAGLATVNKQTDHQRRRSLRIEKQRRGLLPPPTEKELEARKTGMDLPKHPLAGLQIGRGPFPQLQSEFAAGGQMHEFVGTALANILGGRRAKDERGERTGPRPWLRSNLSPKGTPFFGAPASRRGLIPRREQKTKGGRVLKKGHNPLRGGIAGLIGGAANTSAGALVGAGRGLKSVGRGLKSAASGLKSVNEKRKSGTPVIDQIKSFIKDRRSDRKTRQDVRAGRASPEFKPKKEKGRWPSLSHLKHKDLRNPNIRVGLNQRREDKGDYTHRWATPELKTHEFATPAWDRPSLRFQARLSDLKSKKGGATASEVFRAWKHGDSEKRNVIKNATPNQISNLLKSSISDEKEFMNHAYTKVKGGKRSNYSWKTGHRPQIGYGQPAVKFHSLRHKASGEIHTFHWPAIEGHHHQVANWTVKGGEYEEPHHKTYNSGGIHHSGRVDTNLFFESGLHRFTMPLGMNGQARRLNSRLSSPNMLKLNRNGDASNGGMGIVGDSALRRRSNRNTASPFAPSATFRADRKAKWPIQPPGIGWYSEI